MGVAVASKGPKNQIISAAVPKAVKKEVDAFAHDADFSRSEATTLLILAGLALLAVLATSDEAARAARVVLGDQEKVKRYAPRVLRQSLELMRTVGRGE